jgi:DHA1 family bicyclomycin/chloramphenicol resistance-like MFS transporter
MTLPALPAHGAVLSAAPDQVQLTLSLYLVGYAAGQIVIGPWSDRFGRRRVLVGGLAVYSLATLACAASPGIGILIAARLFQGVSACGGPVMVRAIVRDHFEGDRAAHMMSSLTTVFAVGPLLAPIIGGALLVRYGWPSIFLFIAFWSLVLLVVTWALLAESLRGPDHQALQPARILANYRTFFTTRAAVGYAGLNGLCSLGMFAFLSGSPFVLIEIYVPGTSEIRRPYPASAVISARWRTVKVSGYHDEATTWLACLCGNKRFDARYVVNGCDNRVRAEGGGRL